MTKQEIKDKIIEIRHHIHRHPEINMDTVETAAYVKGIMEELGCTTEYVGGTGLVATMKCGNGDKMIGLRADMDALSIQEESGVSHRSVIPGLHHGCGHDSHTAGLIGTAMLLRESQDFNGTVVFIFQPAEEPGLGAKAMIEDGLFEKYPISEIYGQHNRPGLKVGAIQVKYGQCYSSEDDFWIKIKGFGGHASAPHNLKDPIVTASEIVVRLQTIISRSLNPLDAGTCSVCDIQTGGRMNTVPSEVLILGDCRSYKPEVSLQIEERMRAIVQHICEMNGCTGEVIYDRVFTPTVNNDECTDVVLAVGEKVLGKENVIITDMPNSGSEDFGQFSALVPGCYFDTGIQSDENEEVIPVHNTRYDFNDDAIMVAPEMFAQIVRERLK